MIARQPALDGFDHAVPIEQQVEGDNRCDHKQRDDIQQGLAGIPDGRQQSRQPAGPLFQQIIEVFADVDRAVTDQILNPLALAIGETACSRVT